jgi:FtsP/CotA-like multicopper oxidase with cupredoxin domain
MRIENAMDGVPGATQAPVKPGENFRYKLKLEDA